MRYFTKLGKHGTLFLYRIDYKVKDDGGSPIFDACFWAYSEEHALDRFLSDDDDGWEVLAVKRVENRT